MHAFKSFFGRGQKMVLVIDDSELTRLILRRHLEKDGFGVIEAGDGDAGFKAAEKNLPDLILCDIIMPVQDGWRTLAALRAHKKTSKIPVIVVTAKNQASDIDLAIRGGANDFMPKPIKPERLSEKVKRVLAGYKLS